MKKKFNLKSAIKKMKPFWREREELESEFRRKEYKLEQKMKEELGKEYLGIFFFYVDGNCVGIGSEEFVKGGRRKFPLIHDADLEEE